MWDWVGIVGGFRQNRRGSARLDERRAELSGGMENELFEGSSARETQGRPAIQVHPCLRRPARPGQFPFPVDIAKSDVVASHGTTQGLRRLAREGSWRPRPPQKADLNLKVFFLAGEWEQA